MPRVFGPVHKAGQVSQVDLSQCCLWCGKEIFPPRTPLENEAIPVYPPGMHILELRDCNVRFTTVSYPYQKQIFHSFTELS